VVTTPTQTGSSPAYSLGSHKNQFELTLPRNYDTFSLGTKIGGRNSLDVAQGANLLVAVQVAWRELEAQAGHPDSFQRQRWPAIDYHGKKKSRDALN
jgi:hypothetical protein